MEAAAAYLTQYIQLLADDDSADVASDPSQADAGGAATFLMVQAQQALADCAEFQTLLARIVPDVHRKKAQHWLMRRLYQCLKPEQLASWIENELVKMVPSIKADESLIGLIQQIQGLPNESRDRRNLIQTLLIEIQSSDRLKRRLKNLPPELYFDALHNTLLWFCDHLDDYDPSLSGPMTWFNRNLFYQGMKIVRSLNRPLPDRLISTEKDLSTQQSGSDTYDSLMVEAEYQIIDDLYDWIQRDATGNLKRTALIHRLDINVQSMLQAVLTQVCKLRSLNRISSSSSMPPSIQPYDIFSEQATTLSQLFEQLSLQFDYPPEKLRRFWREKCRPYIEYFLQQSGHL